MTAAGAGVPFHVAIATRAAAPQHGHGGLERAVTAHVRSLARLGVRLTVFTQPADAEMPAPDDCGGMVTWREIPYRRVPLRRNSIPDRLIHYAAFSRRTGRAIADLARRESVDIVHAHGLAGLGYAEATQGFAGAPPLILNPHGLEEFSQRSRAKWLAYAPFRHGLRRAARNAAAVIATDRALAEPIRRHLGIQAERIALIPNGIELSALDALVRPALMRELRARYALESTPLTLVSIARLERNKGLREGVAALSLLRDRLPDGWRWLIIGQGTEADALRAAIEHAGLARNVALAGALSDAETQNLLACADLCLVPSLYEGSSLTALEALGRRIPVIATPVGGLPDKVIPGETGFLAAQPIPSALAAAMLAALDARASWPHYGAQARALVEREFDWAVLGERYVRLYHGLVGQHS
jgi:glycosyltransferase involved in cell wall biosynthesis